MAAKGSVEAIIEVAKKEVGTIEGPKDNETKYGAWIKVNFQPWCQSFVSWSAFTAGVKSFPKSASTVAASDWFKKAERWSDARNDDPQAGDWIYFDFPDDGVNRISHVGLCIKNNGDGTIQVIEGNTSGTAKGDQRNGGMCVEKTRAYVKNNKKKLIGIRKFITNSFHCSNVIFPQFFSQFSHMNIDSSISYYHFRSPNVLQNMISFENLPWFRS